MEKKKITCAYCKRRASVHLMCFGGEWNHSYYLCWEHFKGKKFRIVFEFDSEENAANFISEVMSLGYKFKNGQLIK